LISPIPWPGGKRLLLKRLVALLPEHETYIEPFCGGAGLLFAKQPAAVEVINDLDSELINFYQSMAYRPMELLDGFRWMLHSRKWFDDLRNSPPSELDPIQRAVRFFYLRKSSFGGIGKTFGTSKKRNQANYLLHVNDVIAAAHQRLKGVTIEQLDFAECIRRFDHEGAVIYCDPPYRGKDKFYACRMADADYRRLRDALAEARGKWLVSHSDDEFIRELFKDFRITKVKTSYSMAGGKNRESIARPRHELLISNYELPEI